MGVLLLGKAEKIRVSRRFVDSEHAQSVSVSNASRPPLQCLGFSGSRVQIPPSRLV